MFAGLGTAMLWRYLGWQTAIYEGMPGILAGLLVLSAPLLLKAFLRKPDKPR
jgi:hypothetical protein